MTSPQAFRSDPEMFERLYRGEPTFDGAPPPTGIPWDVGHAQPRLMELEALGGVTGEVLDIGCGLSYAAGLHRATRSGARWHLYCFSDGNVNGVRAPRAAVTEQNIRDTLTANGWRIEFLGPTTYLANTSSFGGNPNNQIG